MHRTFTIRDNSSKGRLSNEKHSSTKRIKTNSKPSFRCWFTAIWWIVFSIPMLRHVKQVYYLEPQPKPIRHSLKRLIDTFRKPVVAKSEGSIIAANLPNIS